MGIKYKFTCQKCNYHEENISVGQSKLECKNQVPPCNFGTCTYCNTVFSNKERFCSNCGKGETPWFQYKIFKLVFLDEKQPQKAVKLYRSKEVNLIPCPKCNHEYLTPHSRMFYD